MCLLLRCNFRPLGLGGRTRQAQAIIDWIEVDQGTICIMGRKDILEQAVTNGGHITPGVRTCIAKWRAVQDKSANTYVIEVEI
jgi:hypothetical protein